MNQLSDARRLYENTVINGVAKLVAIDSQRVALRQNVDGCPRVESIEMVDEILRLKRKAIVEDINEATEWLTTVEHGT